LEYPRLVILAAHHAKRGIGIAAADGIRIAELDTIKEVKNLSTKLQVKSLIDCRSLECSEIRVRYTAGTQL
jgi:hypothetical protein